MRPILRCCPMTPEEDSGGMAEEAEPSHQYSVTCCCRVTDGSRGAVWQNGIWHGHAHEAKVCHWIPSCGKNSTHWHSSMFAEYLWRPNSEHSDAVCSALQQWWQWQWVTSTDADFLWGQHSGSCSSLIKMHSLWWWLCWKSVLRSWEFALSNRVTMLFVSVVVSTEIIRRHYFQSNLHKCSTKQFFFSPCSPGKPKGWTPMVHRVGVQLFVSLWLHGVKRNCLRPYTKYLI